MRSAPRCRRNRCLPIPKGLTAVQAAGIPETFFTVWTNVFQRGKLKYSESILIHGGTSGIGTTAIQLARAFGAQRADHRRQRREVRSRQEARRRARVQLPQHRLGRRGQDASPTAAASTSSSTSSAATTWPAISICWRWRGGCCRLRFSKTAKAELDFSVMMRKRAWITGSTLRPRSPVEKGAIARDLHEHVWPLLEQGVVAPVIHEIFPLAQASEAHRLMESSGHIGKIILDVRQLITAERRTGLFTPRFYILWTYNLIVFLSAFQLLPVAPFHIMALGGSGTEAGLFLGFLTYSSAISAPITGALGDRYGKRNMLLMAAVALTVFSLLYAVAPSYQIILGLVLIHGVFWSCLLSSSSAYMMDIIPAARRAEGLGYSGFASILGVAIAPWIGLWVFDHGGWTWMCIEAAALNLVMAVIAWRLPKDARHAAATKRLLRPADLIEWRVLVLAGTLVSLRVQLRRHHQLRRGVRRTAWRDATGDVFHRARAGDPGHASLHRPLCRPRRPHPHHRAVPRAGRARRGGADHRRQPADVRGLGAAVWRRVRLRLSAVCRAPDAPYARASPRRHVRRDDRGL